MRLVLELVLFGLGAAALAHAGQPTLAGVFAVVAGLNIILLRVWRQ